MILFVLLLFHGLIGYAGPTTLFKPIHAVIYDALFAIEILALTACIIFHQFDAHWLGYVLVYFAIVLTWFEFFPLTIRTQKVYEVNPEKCILVSGKFEGKGATGVICEGWRKFYVHVCGDDAFEAAKQGKTFYAKFLKMERNNTIWMEAVPSDING